MRHLKQTQVKGSKIRGEDDNGSFYLDVDFVFFLPDLSGPFCPFSMGSFRESVFYFLASFWVSVALLQEDP